MDIQVKTKNGALPPALKTYAEKKINKLGKYFHSIRSAEVEQAVERGMHIVQLSVDGDGVLLRSQDRSNDMYAAVDSVVSKLERQIKRFKSKLRHDHDRFSPSKEAVAGLVAGEDGAEDGPYVPRIARRKRFPMKPMSAAEAARQMELVDHDFFLFANEETGEVNVLYRRRDGDYGLIEPER